MKEAGIHAIIQKIKADAERHSSDRYSQIKGEADLEINSEMVFHQDELSKRRETLKNHNEHEYAILLDRMKSRFHRELLTYRNHLIDAIFDMAATKLRAASEEELTNMFLTTVEELKGNFSLYIGEYSEGKLNADVIEKVRNRGLFIVLNSDAVPRKSGFLLSNDTVEYNCLFEDLIEDKKSEQAAMILKEVFGDA